MVHLNYKDNDYSIGERENFLYQLKQESLNNGVLINTCNRIEYYNGNGFVSEEIAKHLFSVAAGLKSNLLGDTSIQGQIKIAYAEACQRTKLDKSIHKLFQTAFFVGKKVRSQTSISQGAVSYPQAALEILLSQIDQLENKNITILGVHNINENIVQSLAKKEISTLFIGNRTYEKAEILAKKHDVKAFRFDQLYEHLQHTDVLISATSAPHAVIRANKFPKNKKMFIIDLAVPRDVEEEVGNLDQVVLVNVEQVEKQVNQNLGKRKEQLIKAREIVAYELKRFMNLQKTAYAPQSNIKI